MDWNVWSPGIDAYGKCKAVIPLAIEFDRQSRARILPASSAIRLAS